MKSLILLLAVTTTLSAQAGTLINKATGEFITFTQVNPADESQSAKIIMDSSRAGGSKKTFTRLDVQLSSTWVSKRYEEKGYFEAMLIAENSQEYSWTRSNGGTELNVGKSLVAALIPVYGSPMATAVVVDVASLPARVIKNALHSRQNKDEEIIRNVVLTEKSEEVSEVRFHRIFKNLDKDSAETRRQLMNVQPLEGETKY